jgi:hypothetical protein
MEHALIQSCDWCSSAAYFVQDQLDRPTEECQWLVSRQNSYATDDKESESAEPQKGSMHKSATDVRAPEHGREAENR